MSGSPGMSSSWSSTESYALFRRQSCAKDVLQGMRAASKTFMYQSTLPGMVKSPVYVDKFPHLCEELHPTIYLLTWFLNENSFLVLILHISAIRVIYIGQVHYVRISFQDRKGFFILKPDR